MREIEFRAKLLSGMEKTHPDEPKQWVEDILKEYISVLQELNEKIEYSPFLREYAPQGEKERKGNMNEDLIERRSAFVYNAARLAATAANAPIIPVRWIEREEPFKKQFREVIERQCSDQRSRSPEELHGSWMQAYFLMGWKYGEKYDREKKKHPDLVPYEQLGQLEKDKDSVFVELCEIARKWIY